MGWWNLRLSAKILAFLRLSANFFQLRLTKKLILISLYFFVSLKQNKGLKIISACETSYSFEKF